MPGYYEFEVSLVGIRPRIWRRFLLRSNSTFADLHRAIQACGWEDAHLFAFRDLGGRPIAGGADEEFGQEPVLDARRVKLSSYFGKEEGRRCLYEYDFGDSWEHEVELRGTTQRPETFERRLVAGARAFPPEDCGGTPGYQACVRMATKGLGPRYLKEWLGDWMPESFDLEAAKAGFDR